MNETLHASAPGKIILCGEYAVVFGHAGIAVPAKQQVEVTYELGSNDWNLEWNGLSGDRTKADAYVHKILDACPNAKPGILHIHNTIPLGKGMGSSTALTIAIARAVGISEREEVLAIENIVNPGNSGIDFAVIWEEKPVYFKKPSPPKVIALPPAIIDALQSAILIDTGAPKETTPELVTWITMRHVQGYKAIEPAIHAIGGCANRMQTLVTLSPSTSSGQAPVEARQEFANIIRDHHQAQVNLGVVSTEAQSLIKKIEQEGGCAKVIGAGGKTGGSGMVIAFGADPKIAKAMGFKVVEKRE